MKLLPTTSRYISDQGFSMVELIVGMVITAIIMAVAVPSFSGAKQYVSEREAVTVAQTYVIAIEDFRTSHAGRPPIMSRSGDVTPWNSYNEWRIETPDASALGPQSSITRQPYVSGMLPDSISSKRVVIGRITPQVQNPPNTLPAPNTVAWVGYGITNVNNQLMVPTQFSALGTTTNRPQNYVVRIWLRNNSRVKCSAPTPKAQVWCSTPTCTISSFAGATTC